MAHPTPDDLALIALGEDTDAEVLAHVDGCRACFAEVEALQQVVAVSRSLGPDDRLTAPHPRVWQRIATGTHDGRVIPLPGAVTLQEAPRVPPAAPEPVTLGGVDAPQSQQPQSQQPRSQQPRSQQIQSQQPRPERPRRRPGRLTAALVAAALLVVGLAGGYGLGRAGDPVTGRPSVTQLNALPRWSGANGTATVRDDGGGQRTLVVTMQLPATISVDGTFEVWMSDSRAQDMVAMGPMDGGSARFPIPAGFDLATHPIVDVSLEPRGDTDPAHSDISVVRGRLSV